MKIKLLSDLHLEGCHFEYENHGEDILVLAGDIHTRNRLHLFLETIPENTKVIMVTGNHEYYNSLFYEVNDYHKDLESKFPNFTFLFNNSTVIEDMNFFGGTMFTDFMLYGPGEQWFAKQHSKTRINDFHSMNIETSAGFRAWSVEDHQTEHKIFCHGLSHWLKTTEGKKRVVISHFAPHPSTINEKFKMSALNPYFTEDMSAYLGWEGFWLYGHTHTSYNGKVGETTIISNPKGYGNENRNGFDPNLIIEI